MLDSPYYEIIAHICIGTDGHIFYLSNLVTIAISVFPLYGMPGNIGIVFVLVCLINVAHM